MTNALVAAQVIVISGAFPRLQYDGAEAEAMIDRIAAEIRNK